MAGLLAARTLRDSGISVSVLEGEGQVGGRLATRRVGQGLADVGAQYFTVRTVGFNHWVRRWLDDGLLFEWSRGWSDGSLHRVVPNGHPRYAVRGGMGALARQLAAGLTCHTGQMVTRLVQAGDGWQVEAATGDVFTARAVLLTMPAPQALRLLQTSEVPLPEDDRAALEELRYLPSLTGIFRVEGVVYLPAPGAFQRAGTPVRWVADNTRKGISPDERVLTVQAAPEYSRENWDMDDDAVLDELYDGFDSFAHPDVVVLERQLMRWRYAMPEVTFPQRAYTVPDVPPLVLAGDAFGGPRVEGAALSGLVAASQLVERLK